MKLLSDASEYALRAVVWLAQQPAGAYKVRQISNATLAPPGYLVKALQLLARDGILSGQRGSHGGFTLVRDPKSLTVLEVINAVDPIERINSCPLGLQGKGNHLCPVHRQIDDALATIEAGFAASTIADLADAKAAHRCDCQGSVSYTHSTPPPTTTPSSASTASPLA